MPGGPTHPSFKHGRYSKYFPTDLQKRFEEAKKDPNRYNLDDALAILDTRLSERITALTPGDMEHWLDTLRLTIDAAQRALHDNDLPILDTQLARARELLDVPRHNDQTWDQILSILQQRRKLLETEYKRMEALQQTFTIDQARMFVAVLQESVVRHVTDPTTRQAIAGDIVRALNVGVLPGSNK